MNTSWSHLAVRPLVRPLIRIGARPNQVTALHLVLGLGTLLALAIGSPEVRFWAGIAWLISCLLDRLDGELARIGKMTSAAGHRFDYMVDMWLTALYFPALGLSVHGPWHIAAGTAGVVAGVTQLGVSHVAERYDSLSGDNGKVLASRWGFDADDALYILGPLMWVPEPLRLGAVMLAALAIALFLLLFLSRLRRLKRQMQAS